MSRKGIPALLYSLKKFNKHSLFSDSEREKKGGGRNRMLNHKEARGSTVLIARGWGEERGVSHSKRKIEKRRW